MQRNNIKRKKKRQHKHKDNGNGNMIIKNGIKIGTTRKVKDYIQKMNKI